MGIFKKKILEHRLIKEYKELCERRKKLIQFIELNDDCAYDFIFVSPDKVDSYFSTLKKQRGAMSAYKHMLERRFEILGITYSKYDD